jgi:hypothetical protein
MLLGCAGDPLSEPDTGASTGDVGTTEATTHASMSGAGDGDESTSDADAPGTSATSGSSAPTTSGDDTTDDAGTDTADDDPCAGLDRADCQEKTECRPIACGAFESSADAANAQWCIGAPEYLGCVPADLGCVEVRTVACDDADDDAVFMCPDGCLPEGFSMCEPPARAPQPCR